jgi:hypothetical protein
MQANRDVQDTFFKAFLIKLIAPQHQQRLYFFCREIFFFCFFPTQHNTASKFF